MRRIISFATIIISAIAFAGCNKLNQQPISSLPASAFWQTPQDAATGNAAIYAGMQNVFTTAFIEWGDARSDNFTYSGTGEFQVDVALNGINSTDASADWGSIYTTILRANLAIKYDSTISGLTQTQINDYNAQAYAVRAFMYFWAVRLWGDVPVRLTPYQSLDSVANLARTNKDSVINNVVIPDLLRAESLINTSDLSPFQVTEGGVLSALMEVYLWQQNYAGVLSTYKQLQALNRYTLEPAATYKNVFVPGSNPSHESIWSLNWNWVTDGTNGIGLKIGSTGNTSNYKIDTAAFNKLQANPADIRANIDYDTSKANAYGIDSITIIWKYYPLDLNTGLPNVPARSQNSAVLPFYRWADILLMAAEAYNMGNNDQTTALGLVNQVRARANATQLNAANYATQTAMTYGILKERQIELFAEGKRWFDLVRYNTPAYNNLLLTTMDPLVRARQASFGIFQTGFTDPRKILWPISRQALISDPLLVQNPPYSE